MRNKFPGVCYYCYKAVEVGKGHFESIPPKERINGVKWRLIHADTCTFQQRARKSERKVPNGICGQSEKG